MADKDILADARDFLARAESSESTNRKTWRDDVKFARLGEQWPEKIRAQRELERRPCLTINKLGPVIRQVVNDARQNRPSIKVLPQDDKADPQTAEIMTGLVRNIEQTSDADVAYDTAIDAAVSGGFGYWRVNLDYANDVSLDQLDALGNAAFEQDICIKRIMNPLSVYGDPDSTQADSSDWMKCIVTESMSEAKFKKKYPKAKVSSFDATEWATAPEAWKNDKEAVVAEYWVREEVTVLVIGVQMPDTPEKPGDVVVMRLDDWEKRQGELEPLGATAVTEPRPVKSYKVTQHIVTGVEVLESKPWPGIYIPIVPVYGDEVIVDGKRHLRSLISDARGPQEQYNFWSTASTEQVALAPRVPWIGRKGAFDSDPNWDTANSASHAYLEFDGPERPTREPPPSISAGDLRLALNAADDIKAVTGMYDASMGARSNETSGKAILARQREGDVSTFHFIDNLTRAIRHTGRIIIDLIPKVYTTPRIIRILGEDGKPDTKPINQEVPGENGALVRIHDFRAGRYDLAVTAGPSFTTRREEAASQMIELIRAYPAAAPMIGDLLARNLDWPGADEIAERLQAAMQQQQQGQQQQPDPAAMAKAQIEGGKLQVSQFEAETDRMRAQAEMQSAMTPQQVQQIVIQTMRQVLPGLAA
jgi:hypothetical protein